MQPLFERHYSVYASLRLAFKSEESWQAYLATVRMNYIRDATRGRDLRIETTPWRAEGERLCFDLKAFPPDEPEGNAA